MLGAEELAAGPQCSVLAPPSHHPHLSSPLTQISLRTPLSLSRFRGTTNLAFPVGLAVVLLSADVLFFCTLPPQMAQEPIQTPLSFSPQILLAGAIRSASVVHLWDPIPMPLPELMPHIFKLALLSPCLCTCCCHCQEHVSPIHMCSWQTLVSAGTPPPWSPPQSSLQTVPAFPCCLHVLLLKYDLLKAGCGLSPTTLGAPGVLGLDCIPFFLFSTQNSSCLLE